MTSPLLTPQQLNAQLDDPNLILLDVSVPKVTGGNAEESDQTIPGALVVDLKRDFSNSDGRFPNTVPTPKQFEETCNQLGITNESKVVVFDNIGVYSSPRVWWLFRVMGHENVKVLNGGLPEWISAGFPTIASVAWDRKGMKSTTVFHPHYHPEWVKQYEEVLKNVDEDSFTIVDARSKGRFEGTDPEPRKQLRSGCIPHSINLPYQNVLDGNRFKSAKELRAIFNDLNAKNELTYSCGSGLTACIVLLAGKLAGIESMKVYDGSWTEWAELQGLKNE